MTKNEYKEYNQKYDIESDKMPWNVYSYAWSENGFAYYIRQVNTGEYVSVKLSDEDLIDGSYLFMFEHDLTRM